MTDVRSNQLSRRQVLRQILGTGACLPPLAELLSARPLAQQPAKAPATASVTLLSPEEDKFLNDLENTNFLYFWEQASPKTGMVKDRCNVRTSNDEGVVASIAATGFGLTALCIGNQRGFVSRSAALERVLAALRFLWKKLPNHRGFFYHFANINNGERVWIPRFHRLTPPFCYAES